MRMIMWLKHKSDHKTTHTHTIIHDGVCDVCFSVWFSSGLHPSLLDAAARDIMQKSRTGLSEVFFVVTCVPLSLSPSFSFYLSVSFSLYLSFSFFFYFSSSLSIYGYMCCSTLTPSHGIHKNHRLQCRHLLKE